MSLRPRRRWLALLVATMAPLPALAAAQLYRLDIRVTSAINRQPAIYARATMSPRVERVEVPDSVLSMARLHVTGLELDATGRVVVLVKPGEYTLHLTKDDHQTVDHTFTVPPEDMPPPAAGEVPTLQLSLEMPVQTKQLPRDIVVTVLGEATDATGRKTTRPLANAAVYVSRADAAERVPHDDARGRSTCLTGEDGVAVFHSEEGLGIGDQVRVRATKPEYEPAEELLM
ncbi:MAG: hypothetical protein KKI08_06790, partial [Armatimonadetes bacterium]|nr:hypothetical protein [Armatimonadota bacterium]